MNVRWHDLSHAQQITLQAACTIGQVERGVSCVPGSRKQHSKTINSLIARGLLVGINSWSAIPTEEGRALVEAASISEDIIRPKSGTPEPGDDWTKYQAWMRENGFNVLVDANTPHAEPQSEKQVDEIERLHNDINDLVKENAALKASNRELRAAADEAQAARLKAVAEAAVALGALDYLVDMVEDSATGQAAEAVAQAAKVLNERNGGAVLLERLAKLEATVSEPDRAKALQRFFLLYEEQHGGLE